MFVIFRISFRVSASKLSLEREKVLKKCFFVFTYARERMCGFFVHLEIPTRVIKVKYLIQRRMTLGMDTSLEI